MATTREIYVRERIASAAALAELLGWFWANVLTETAAPLSVKRKINVPPTCVYPDIEILFKRISYVPIRDSRRVSKREKYFHV